MWWYNNKFDSMKSLGVCYWCVKIPHRGYMEHVFKHITFYDHKHIAALAMCHNPGLVRDKPLGVPTSVKLVYWDWSRSVRCYSATTPSWLVVWQGRQWSCVLGMPDNKSLRCCCCYSLPPMINPLTHWVRVTHICVSNRNIIGSDNDWSPGRRPAIIWTNAWIFLIWTLRTNLNEILIEIIHLHSRKSVSKYRLENGGHFVSASMC